MSDIQTFKRNLQKMELDRQEWRRHFVNLCEIATVRLGRQLSFIRRTP